mgnify:CR=1 FL=1
MRLVRNSKEFPISLVKEGSIVTIGAFDGLHLGHQELLNAVLDLAANHNLPIIVMSFEPMLSCKTLLPETCKELVFSLLNINRFLLENG